MPDFGIPRAKELALADQLFPSTMADLRATVKRLPQFLVLRKETDRCIYNGLSQGCGAADDIASAATDYFNAQVDMKLSDELSKVLPDGQPLTPQFMEHVLAVVDARLS